MGNGEFGVHGAHVLNHAAVEHKIAEGRDEKESFGNGKGGWNAGLPLTLIVLGDDYFYMKEGVLSSDFTISGSYHKN